METRKINDNVIEVTQAAKVYNFSELQKRKAYLEDLIVRYVGMLDEKHELDEIDVILAECAKLDISDKPLIIEEPIIE